jgi:N-acetylglutamate synthase
VDGANRVRLLSRAKEAVFANVRVNGRVVAAGAGSFSHGWASIHGMRTALSHRGQGLAGGILGALAREAQARQIEPVFLQVDAANIPALALYRRAGFATVWTYEYWRRAAPPRSA